MVNLAKIDLNKGIKDAERSLIRWIRHDNEDEMKRLVEIDVDEQVRKFVEEVTGEVEDLVEFAKNNKDNLGVAVVGKAGHVIDEEIDKLQGWISVYKDNWQRLKRIRVELGDDIYGDQVLEIGFARHPKAKSGQMASAIRQLLGAIKHYFDEFGEKVHVTAYTDQLNEQSEKVLRSAGFNKVAEVLYHNKNKTKDNLFILDWKKWEEKLRS